MPTFIALVLIAALINMLAFGLFWHDKRAARTGRRRISERTLLTVALFGGSLGAMTARHIFRHKTRKEPFRTRLALIVVFQVALAVIGTLALRGS
ncbi:MULTISPECIES: DUF1294 domain-containing protein [unclassified Ensifer]|uniref:DUF1294 domain-containing protein n=1 Tax=unclassified Ensifer TaxID=2633371 RepID=UPI000813AA01|nr:MULTISPECIES: DUF1294 domain-containing protein [unclassified Ensifer]OCP01220.1 hypothetical protein BC362_22485 [Ensifer sp. LC14]OCP03112.1 hypothetical protein BBX50_05605 [Ensifer sp. LC11]OCP03482.1 hypothetical protein BC374_05665 [Ensifer sp. LC13]OCP33895.1 hypothetical protein BC364_13155 [Ensifer sp. LC499]